MAHHFIRTLRFAASCLLATSVANGAEPLPSPMASHVAQFVGAGSCAATACHGGPVNSTSAWQSSYTVWATRDPHAKAYAVLWNARSKNIVEQLEGRADVEPWKNARCLACHSLVDNGGAGAQNGPVVTLDGVSCEACHGAAQRWLSVHTTAAWKSLDAAKDGARFGFRNTKDLSLRAEQCVRCHVGAAGTPEEGGQEVDHDLIAAGHPRLMFEFSAYQTNMPVHWDPRKDTVANREARTWAVGQVVAARAASALQADHKPRFEFADHDCYACHHELQGRGARQRAYYASAIDVTKVNELKPSTWYTGMFEQLQTSSGVAVLDSITPKKPDDGQRLEAARKVERWIGQQPLAEVQKLSAAIAAKGEKLGEWEDATQAYLALVALNNARLEHLTSPTNRESPTDTKIRELLAAIYRDLEFTKMCRGADGSVTYDPVCPDQTREVVKFDSPQHYDPAKVQAKMRGLAALLTLGADRAKP